MFDYTSLKTAEPKKIYLAKPGGQIIGGLAGVATARLTMNLNDIWTLQLEVDKYIQGSQNPLYDQLLPFMEIHLRDIGNFRINSAPGESQQDGRVFKEFTAYGLETQLQDLDLSLFHINCGTATSREMYPENQTPLNSPIRSICLYIDAPGTDPSSDKYYGLGLLNILETEYLTDKGWKIGHVDIELQARPGRSFEIDNENIYSFLTQEVSKAYDCMFIFDRLNKQINVRNIASIGKSLNIECSFRNLINSVDIRDSKDILSTQYRVAGASEDTGIVYVNFGEDTIENLSYFMTPTLYSQDFIDRYNAYTVFRETRRRPYSQTFIDEYQLQTQIDALTLRQPVVEASTSWNAYSLEELNAECLRFEAIMDYLESVHGDQADSPDYTLYLNIRDAILPAIRQEIERQNAGSVTPYEPYDFKTNWELYGIDALTIQKKNYENNLLVLEQAGIPTGNDAAQKAHYEKLKAELTAIITKLEQLTNKVNDLKALLPAIQTQRTEILDSVKITHPNFGFSDSELSALKLLTMTTDFKEEAIEVLDPTDINEHIERGYELLKAAQDSLEIQCRPQLTYAISMDNLYHIEAFKDKAEQMAIGDFMFLELDNGYKTRQRIISVELELVNLSQTDFRVTFSDMVTAYGQADDLRFLLDSPGSGSKNSISQNTKDYITKAAESASEHFINSYLSGASGGQSLFPYGISSADAVKISDALSGLVNGKLSLEQLKTQLAEIDSLSANSAFMTYLESTFLVSNQADFQTLSALTAQIKAAIVGDIAAASGMMIQLTSDNAVISEAFVRSQISQFILVNDLKAQDISTNQFTITSDDGGIKIAGNTIQFTNDKGDICMQIGRDAEGNFSFIITDDKGSILLDPTGLHEAAIVDGLIKTKMIADNAIDKNKIDWPSAGFDEDEDGNITLTASHVTIDDKSLSSVFMSMGEKVDGNTNTLTTHSSSIEQNSESIKSLMTATTITKEDGATVGIKEQLNQTISDVNGQTQKLGSLETTVSAASGAIASMQSTQSEFKNTIDEFGVSMSSIKTDTQDLAKQIENSLQYTIILTNESHTFAGGTNSALAGNTTSGVMAYKGKIQKAVTIGTITNLPAGMTATVSNNGTIDTSFTITVTTTMSTKSGILAIPISVDGVAFIKNFTYSLALTGADGTPGRNYFLEADSLVIKKGADSIFSPSSVTFSSFYRDGSSATRIAYTGRFIIQESIDGVNFTTKYTSSSNESSKAYTPSSAGVRSIKCTMYAAGGTTSALDTQSVAILTDIDNVVVGGRNLVIGTSIADVSKWYHYGWDGYWKTYSINEKTYEIETRYGWRVAVYDMTNCVGETITISYDVWLDPTSTNTNTIEVKTVQREYSTNTGGCVYGGALQLVEKDRWCHYEDTVILSKPYLGIYVRAVESDGVTGVTRIRIKNLKYERGNIPTDWTPAPEDVNNEITTVKTSISEVKSDFTVLNEKIAMKVEQKDIDTVEKRINDQLIDSYSTTSEMMSALELTSDGIFSKVSADYTSKNDMSGYVDKQIGYLNESISTANKNITTLSTNYKDIEDDLTLLEGTVSSSITHTAKNIELKFAEAITATNDLADDTDKRLEQYETNIRFDENGISIGKEDNPIALQIQNDRISFSQTGTEVAYISNQQLYISRAEIVGSLQLNQFVFEPRANGNVSLYKKR